MWNLVEAWLTQQLLRQPIFHRAVGVVHKRVHQLKTGQPPPEPGGTHVEDKKPSLVKHFLNEVRDQARDLKPGTKSKR